VLHVLKSLPLGGIETWLMHVLRRDRDSSVQHELLLMVEEPGVYEPEARELGITIHKLPKKAGWLRWFADLRKFLREHGPFDTVHSHAAYAAGAPIVAIAALAGVPGRIAHQHEANSLGKDYQTLRHRLVQRGAMMLYPWAATKRVGITDAAIEEIAGKSWRSKKDCSVLLYGFDYSAFDKAEDRAQALRRAHNLNADHRVIGHVGRFVAIKNHGFLLRMFAQIAREDPAVQLVLVGEGPLKPEMEQLAQDFGLEDRVRFAGSTQDVAAYMALFDLFLLPSFSEGLGIVCVEAQAAGTRVLASDTVAPEAAVVPGGVDFLPLAAGESAWAEHVMRLLALPKPDPDQWRRMVEESAFGIERCLRDLHAIYREQPTGRR
jgi:glycosyltransferase involved in cell wall biosynthesis